MSTKSALSAPLTSTLGPIAYYLQRPLRLIRNYNRQENLRADLIAGLTVAIIMIPQAIAFAVIAELPPQMGLYAGIVGTIVAALWGSSDQIHIGPTNALSLLVFSALSGVRESGDVGQLMVAAGMMAVMIGVFQLFLGFARLGVLVNFVSHSVIVGFASGAGVLIGIKQLEPFFGLDFEAEYIYENILNTILLLPQSHVPSALLGATTVIVLLIIRRVNPRLPAAFLAMIFASVVVYFGNLDQFGVSVIGQLPTGFPPIANLPLLDLELISELSAGALAVAAIGLVSTTAISRSISAQTGQRLDVNQEFVGQGLANLAAGFFTGYACGGSFARSAVNFRAGAKTPVAAILCGILVLIAMLILGPLAAYLPRTALAGVLIVTAINMIDREEISRIWQGAHGDAAIMLITFIGTLLLDIEFAVMLGILFSFALYIMRTSAPTVHAVLPDHNFKHFTYQPDKAPCVQLAILDIRGDLYFGAVNHVEEIIMDYVDQNPEQRFLLLRMHHVNHCDFSGIHMLEAVVQTFRDRGGDVFLVRVSEQVAQLMETTDFNNFLGKDHFLPDDLVISHIFHHVLDPAVCIYECPYRVFKECANLPKRIDLVNIPLNTEIPANSVIKLKPEALWQRLYNSNGSPRPLIVDVREPREFRQGHLPYAESIPLSRILTDEVTLPNDRQIVLVCRTGRRSRRAAYALHKFGIVHVAILEGGIWAWEAAGLLEAIDD